MSKIDDDDDDDVSRHCFMEANSTPFISAFQLTNRYKKERSKKEARVQLVT